jgi:hypothetical protein
MKDVSEIKTRSFAGELFESFLGQTSACRSAGS